MKRIFSSLLLGLALVFGAGLQTGCTTTQLASDGTYAGNVAEYKADVTIGSLYTVIDTFLIWEKKNQVSLGADSKVHKFAEDLRHNAPNWFQSATALKKAYTATPTDENRKAYEKILATIRAAVTEAAKYLAEGATP